MKTANALTKNFSVPNLSFTHRQVRFVLGATMLVVPMIAAPETLGMWSFVLLASIPVMATAIMGWDPVYAVLGKSSYIPGEEDIQQRNWALPNIGILDRGVRFSIGAILILSLLGMGAPQINVALGLIAIPLITSAIIAWDPIYAAFRINSFGSRTDVTAAEPNTSETTLAKCYTFPSLEGKTRYSRAA